MTINPSDVNDPITQILAGEEINMANFINTAGPTLTEGKEYPQQSIFSCKILPLHYQILEELFRIQMSKENS